MNNIQPKKKKNPDNNQNKQCLKVSENILCNYVMDLKHKSLFVGLLIGPSPINIAITLKALYVGKLLFVFFFWFVFL